MSNSRPETDLPWNLYRRGQQEVEVLTFDELYERARFIVERKRPNPVR